MGPNRNHQQGGHFFLNLTTGERLTRHAWTEMPMPTLVADRVDELGRQQAMTLTFGDRHANEIPDNLEELAAEADAHDGELYIDDSSSNHDDDELEGFLKDDDDDTNGSTR